MFAARGIAVSFSVFAMVYCGLSLVVIGVWRKVRTWSQELPAGRAADALFALRMLPLLGAAVITGAVAVPSFILLEPRATDEPLFGPPLLLGLCGAGLMIFGVRNVAQATGRAWRAISEWTRDARLLDSGAPVPVLQILRTVPAMTVAGILHPKVLLSAAVEFLLTTGELRAAMNHELAHVRRRDNLRKLVLRFVAFPGMQGLEDAWLEATEMAADDAAVANLSEALDLAAALIKLSRLGVADSVVLATGLVHSPAASVNARVERLIAWNEARVRSSSFHEVWYGAGAALMIVTTFAVTYSRLLTDVHVATEWLVR